MKNRIPWGRLVAEFFVIIAGVLTAFSVDATWDGRQEANEVARDLEPN